MTDPGADIIAQLLNPERQRKVLAAGAAQAETAYRNEPTKQNLEAWQAAMKELSATIQPQATPEAQAPEVTYKTLRDAADYLQNSGWKCGKDKLNADLQAGHLSRNKEGLFPQKTLDDYAVRYCKPLTGVVSRDKRIEELAERKMKAETELSETKAELAAMQAKLRSGYYVEATSRDRFLALRLQRLKDDFKADIHSQASRKIELVGGDPTKIADLIAFELEQRARWLARYADEAQHGRPWVVAKVSDAVSA